MHEIAIRTIFVLTGAGQGLKASAARLLSPQSSLDVPLTAPPPSPAPAGFNFNKQTKMLTITSANSQRASKAKPGFKRPIRNSRLSCILIRGFTRVRVRCYSSCEVGGLPGFTFMHDPRYTKDWLALDEIILLCWPWRVHWRAIEFNRMR